MVELLKSLKFPIQRLSRARRVIENAFGIMAARWRIFLKAIPAFPNNVKHIVRAGVVLHNFLTKAEPKYSEEGYGDRFNANGTVTLGQWRNELSETDRKSCCFKDVAPKAGQNSSRKAKDVRDTFKKYFNEEAGSVPWQWTYFN